LDSINLSPRISSYGGPGISYFVTPELYTLSLSAEQPMHNDFEKLLTRHLQDMH